MALVFALSLTVLHSRYLVMPFSMGLAYGSRPTLIWYLIAWFVVENAKFVGDAVWVVRIVVLLALLIGPLVSGALYRRLSPIHGLNNINAGASG